MVAKLVRFVVETERRLFQVSVLQQTIQNIVDQLEIISKNEERNKDIDYSLLELQSSCIRLDDEVNKDIHFRKTSKIVSECTQIVAMAIRFILDCC